MVFENSCWDIWCLLRVPGSQWPLSNILIKREEINSSFCLFKDWLFRSCISVCRFYDTFFQDGFSTLALLTFGTGYFFVVGDCPVHWRKLNNIDSPYPLDASSKLPSLLWQLGMPPDIATCPLLNGGEVAKLPVVKNHGFRNSLGLIIELRLSVQSMNFEGGTLLGIMRIKSF